jgi:protein-L-isoaspartate(D-aspartate) O-methyltransferase
MATHTELSVVRRAYAKRLMKTAGVSDARIEQAFATVPRELFLGAGPWKIGNEDGTYLETPGNDATHLYTDRVVGILPDRGLNNGQPSFHAALMAHAEPKAGEHAVHIGAGVGYYSAILAELVGPGGRVSAIEFDGGLARRATINLRSWSQVRVIHGDGSAAVFEMADVIYVSAGATRPAEPWLDRLAEGGRLILPLTVDSPLSDEDTPGAVFRIERRGDAYRATWISAVAIYACVGARDEVSERALAAALRNGREKDVRRLYRRKLPPTEQCWLTAPGWCLAYQ